MIQLYLVRHGLATEPTPDTEDDDRVLTPDGEPFWGGTYFPPEPRWGRPSFRQILQGVARAWTSGDSAVLQNRDTLSQALARMSESTPGGAITPAMLEAVADALLVSVDRERGGLGSAPKFPNVPVFRFLWQEHARTGRVDAADAVRLLVKAMSQGGIYDHLGGGYAATPRASSGSLRTSRKCSMTTPRYWTCSP